MIYAVAIALVMVSAGLVHGFRSESISLRLVLLSLAGVLGAVFGGYARASKDARRRASLPRSFRARHRGGPRDVGWWVWVVGAIAWSVGAIFFAPNSGFEVVGIVFLLVEFFSEIGEAIFLSTRDERT
ncbi:MAG: hypothetical protein ACKO7G_15170 [Gammaproteobacteria bacterium]